MVQAARTQLAQISQTVLRRAWLVALVVTGALASAGIALLVWNADPVGPGTSKGGTSRQVDLRSTGTSGGTLVPLGIAGFVAGATAVEPTAGGRAASSTDGASTSDRRPATTNGGTEGTRTGGGSVGTPPVDTGTATPGGTGGGGTGTTGDTGTGTGSVRPFVPGVPAPAVQAPAPAGPGISVGGAGVAVGAPTDDGRGPTVSITLPGFALPAALPPIAPVDGELALPVLEPVTTPLVVGLLGLLGSAH